MEKLQLVGSEFIMVTQLDGEKLILSKKAIETVVGEKSASQSSGIKNSELKAAISFIKNNREQTAYVQDPIEEIFARLVS